MCLCSTQQNPHWCNKHKVHTIFSSLYALLQEKQSRDLERSTCDTRSLNDIQPGYSECSFSHWWRWKVFPISTGSSRKSKPAVMLLRMEKPTASPHCCMRLVSSLLKFPQMTGWHFHTLELGYQVIYLTYSIPLLSIFLTHGCKST